MAEAGNVQNPEEPVDVDVEEPTSNKPKDTPFRQQRLPACQPVLTPYSVLPIFFAVGIAFIPLGVWIFQVADSIVEIDYDYTKCSGGFYNSGELIFPQVVCDDYLSDYKYDQRYTCICTKPIVVSQAIQAPALFYYGLTNYYQNHRLYAKSRNDQQLRGQLSAQAGCDPYSSTYSSMSNLSVVPCGALANSLFNDSFKLYYMQERTNGDVEKIQLNVTRTGIAWPSDKVMRFKNPSSASGLLNDSFANSQKPFNWKTDIYDLDLFEQGVNWTDTSNEGFENEDLIVWMRTAAFPNFRKLWRRAVHSPGDIFANNLPAGNYTVELNYAYPVNQFGGTKHFIMTSTSWLGGKNYFLGYVYIIVGSFSLASGLLLLILYIKFGKKAEELTNITPDTLYYE